MASAAGLTAADNGRLTDAERAYLVEQLEQSKKDVLASIAGLTPAQWTFKAGPDLSLIHIFWKRFAWGLKVTSILNVTAKCAPATSGPSTRVE